MSLLALAAAANEPVAGISEWVQLFNYPMSFLLIFGLVRGWFVTGPEHKRVIEERNQERAERQEAQRVLTEQALPALRDNEHTLGDFVKVAEKVVDRLDRDRRG